MKRDEAQPYLRRLELLERKAAARRNGTGRPDIIQLRAALHELINEMERLQRPRHGRDSLVCRAKAVLDELSVRRVTRPDPRKNWKKEIEEISSDLQTLEMDVPSVAYVRKSQRALASPQSLGAYADLRTRASSLADKVLQLPLDSRRNAFQSRLSRCRSAIGGLGDMSSVTIRQQGRQAKVGKSKRARLREQLAAERRERRGVSVPTVSGGLPGLGRRR